MGYIVDISEWQPPSKIDYDKFAKQLDWVIVRTQYGSRRIDLHYKTHHRELQKRGIPTAAYAWVRGINIKDMEQEAIDFYNRTKDFNPTFWWLDVEEESMKDMRAGVSAYVQKLRELGAKKVGIYIGHHFYKKFNLKLDEADAIWIPHYGRNIGVPDSKPAYPCDLHQYTSVGRLDGYNGNLDLNRILGDKPLSFFTNKDIKELLEVDGFWGPLTTKALQKKMGTTVDGVISGQYKNQITTAIPSARFGPPYTGSMVIRALQKKLGVTEDGYIGPQTVRALQKYLGTPVDGVISKPSLMVKELQRRLNSGKI